MNRRGPYLQRHGARHRLPGLDGRGGAVIRGASPPVERPSSVPGLAALLTMICAVLWASAAQAQGVQAPPAIAILSPGGVNFSNGTFHLKEASDLSIGGDGLEEGLHLAREYQSGLPSVFSSGMKSQGWTHSLMVSITKKRAEIRTGRTWPVGKEPYIYSISVGGRSANFFGGSNNPTGGWVGSYSPALQDQGTSLVYVGTEQGGTFTFTDRDGSVITITDLRVRQWAFPSGVVLTYHYNSGGLLKSVFSSRGYALIFEGETRWTRACAVNLVRTHAAPGSSCPAGVPSVGYAYSGDTLTRLSAVTDVGGGVTQYEYSPVNDASRMTCVRRPGQSSCRITNQYAACQRQPELDTDAPNLRQMDRVTFQQTSTGETYSYVHSAAPYCPPTTDSTRTVMTASGAGTTEIATNESGAPLSVKEPLGRTTINEYQFTTYPVPPTIPSRIQLPRQPISNRLHTRERQLGPRRREAGHGRRRPHLVDSVRDRVRQREDLQPAEVDHRLEPEHDGLHLRSLPRRSPDGNGAGGERREAADPPPLSAAFRADQRRRRWVPGIRPDLGPDGDQHLPRERGHGQCLGALRRRRRSADDLRLRPRRRAQ